jgi:DEAD/DEAH box helicase domain-containing protein
VLTDVAEFQPAHLPDLGGAWALVSALREALARRLGIQPSELGMGVEPRRGALAQPTHSLLFYDRNAGGAGFASRLLDDLPALLDTACSILSCDVPGCEHGCAACVLTPDLFAQQEIVDRKAALECVERLLDGMRAPQADDAALPQARLSPPAGDAVVRRMGRGDKLTLFAREPFDLAAFSEKPFAGVFAAARLRGVDVRLGLARHLLDGLNTAQRLGLRDAAVRNGFTLWFADHSAASNGAALIATLETDAAMTGWFTRDRLAASIGASWGIGEAAPVVHGTMNIGVVLAPIDPTLMLPKSASVVRVIEADKGRSLRLFGDWFAKLVREELEPLGLWKVGALFEIRYSDRYLRSPLSVALTLRALAGVRDALAGKGVRLPLTLLSAPLDARKNQTPYLLFHDWQRGADRELVMTQLARSFGFDPAIDLAGAQHARELWIAYQDSQAVRLYLDQGFAHWQIAGRDRFDFSAPAGRQAKQLEDAAPTVVGNGNTYIAITTAE